MDVIHADQHAEGLCSRAGHSISVPLGESSRSGGEQPLVRPGLSVAYGAMGTGEREVIGRIVRFLTKHELGSPSVEQWFLVGIDDDQRAIDAVSMRRRSEDEIVEVVGLITPALASQWGLSAGEVRLVLPGEPIHD
jgi:hypothetical protein